jgi:predicted solute-binding protein
MNPKRLAVLTCTAVVLSAGAITSVRLFQSQTSEPTAHANHEALTQQVTATALIQQIAQTDVEQVIQGEIYTQASPVMAQLSEQKSTLEQRLTQLHPDIHQGEIAVATTTALESKLTDLEVQYALDQAKFSDVSPQLLVRKAQIEALRQRLTTITEPI